MEMSGQLHDPAALPPRKEPQVPIGEKTEWATEHVWTLWRREETYPCRELEPRPLSSLLLAVATKLSRPCD
jgi:hypothetical protein